MISMRAVFSHPLITFLRDSIYLIPTYFVSFKSGTLCKNYSLIFQIVPLESPLDDFLKLEPHSKHCISVIYNLIHNVNSGSANSARGAWEDSLGFELPDEHWERILELTHTSSTVYAQDMGLYNVRFYIGFTILMLDLLKYTPLSAMHVIAASNHQQISFTCCGNALNYLSIGLKYLKL